MKRFVSVVLLLAVGLVPLAAQSREARSFPVMPSRYFDGATDADRPVKKNHDAPPIFRRDTSFRKGTPSELAAGIADRMRLEMGISDSQYKKVYKLYLNWAKKEIKADGEFDRREWFDQTARMDSKLDGILNAFQMVRWKMTHPDVLSFDTTPQSPRRR